MLNGKSGHFCLVPDIRGKEFSSFTLEYDIGCGFFIDALYYVENIPFYF